MAKLGWGPACKDGTSQKGGKDSAHRTRTSLAYKPSLTTWTLRSLPTILALDATGLVNGDLSGGTALAVSRKVSVAAGAV
jgi:hypothetical protein